MPDSPITDITPTVKLLNSQPDIPGYRDFIGTYLVLGEKKALVDIGPKMAVNGVLKALRDAGIKPDEIDYVILTHIHIDHGGGTGLALKSLRNAKVLAHARGKSHLVEPSALWKASLDTLGDVARRYGDIEPVPVERIITAEDGMKLDLGKGVILQVVLTPGHSAHHLSVFEPGYRVLLAGDAAGIYSNGALRLTTPPPFRLEDYLASIDKLIALNPKWLGYAHFGCYPDAVARLRAAKEKALLWARIAQAGAKAGKSAEQVAQEVREKDPDLSYLKTLNEEEYARDFPLLVTSVYGMMTAKA
ncbi:MAG: MBL fold metallo-hydrolase [Dehalococcoidia bacterium]|nr:MBL fold metallo-hydrolase [Dehalococcoidia bacterium]